MIRWLRKKLGPPGPKELGLSEHNALESRMFSPHTKGFTWEDYDEYVAKHFPVRNAIRNFFRWLGQKKYNAEMRWYEFTSRYFKKQHLLDIRQGYNSYDLYQYGYCDPCEKILYASFNILKDFVEKEEPLRPEAYSSDNGLNQRWKEVSIEIYDLYDYWMVRRAAQDKEIYKLARVRDNFRSPEDEEEYQQAVKVWREAREAFEKEEQANLERLIKVREFMWT